MNNDPKPGLLAKGLFILIPLIVLGGIAVVLSMQTVPAGHVGVEKGWAGDTTGNELEPGTHFINPLHGVQNVECRPRTYTMAHVKDEGEVQRDDAVGVQSVNGTSHNVDVTIRYNVDCSDGAPTAFVNRWGDEDLMEDKLIRPDARSDIRDEASNIPFDTIYKKPGRELLAQTADSTIRSNFEDESVQLMAVKIRDVSIPENLQERLRDKEAAKVEVEKKEHEIKVEKREAERKRIEAEADADVTEIRGEALRNNPIVLQQDKINAYDEGTVFVVPENSSTPVLLQANRDNQNSTVASSPDGPGA